MENTVRSIKFIDGVFKRAEAAEVLLSLINDKIKFHTVPSLNLKSVYDENTIVSEHRILQLKNTKEIVKSIVVKAHKKDYKITIAGNVIIKLTKRKSNP